MIRETSLFCLAVAALLTVTSVYAETNSYKGTTNTWFTQRYMPLSEGDSVAITTAAGYAAMTSGDDPPILMQLNCAGMGLVSESDDAEITFYCSFVKTYEDSFDVKGIETPTSSTVEVLGGIGRWAGATGTGKFTRVQAADGSGSSTFELTIRTP